MHSARFLEAAVAKVVRRIWPLLAAFTWQSERHATRFRRSLDPGTLAVFEQSRAYFAVNGSEILVLLLDPDDPLAGEFAGESAAAVVAALVSATAEEGERKLVVLDRRRHSGSQPRLDGDTFRDAVRRCPEEARAWLSRRPKIDGATSLQGHALLRSLLLDPELLEFRASAYRASGLGPTEPFRAGDGPRREYAQPKRRSALFLDHCYYNFFYLAQALRRRGWDAVSVSTVSSESPDNRFFHGEDMHLHHPDPVEHQNRMVRFLEKVPERFGIVHTYGVGVLSGIPSNRDIDSSFGRIPWDILALKRRGVLIGYSHSGCLDAVSQSTFRSWSPSMCANCVWADRPDVCSDTRNLNWGRKLTAVVDLFCIETEPALDLKNSPNAFGGPLTFAMDPEVWKPGLVPPEHLRRDRQPGEIVVYHAVGNYSQRTRNEKNVKGTEAVLAAVERLQGEGIPIRLDFVHDVPSIDNRFVQAQADIIVDQLNYGRYGALAREGMMLGKPVVGRLNRMDAPGVPATRCIIDTPIVDADETSITTVLRDLALHSAKREAIGKASREHALHWWSADRLAERFEHVYDHVREYGRPPADEDVP